MVKSTRDMTEIENAKIILVQQQMRNSVSMFSLVSHFPNHRQNKKKEPDIKIESLKILEGTRNC